MKIGIMGCGYVGQAIALHWKDAGHHVTVTTRRLERVFQLQKLSSHVFLLGSEPFCSFIEQQEILVVSVAPDSSSDYLSTYLKTAQQIAAHAQQATNLQQIIYTGSISLYGDHQGNWVDEETPIFSTHANHQILHETEQVLLACHSQNLAVCILRLGEIYGPGREIEQRIIRMHQQPFPGTGHAYTNLIHLIDIVHALDFAVKQRLVGIYNLCNDFHIPRRQFYQRICQEENLPPIQWDGIGTHSHSGNRRVSNQKIKKAGFIFTYPNY